MRLVTLHIENLLSFDEFDLDFDEALTVLVGPNGSGKTNVIRVLDLVTKALDWTDGRWGPDATGASAQLALDAYAKARHHDSASEQPVRVRLGLEFTSARERDLMTTFVQAALLSTALGEATGGQPPTELFAWSSTATEEKLRSLYSGAIVLEHAGIDHAPWDVAYEFCHDGEVYRWVLAGAPTWGGIVRADELSPAGVVANLQSERLLPLLFGSGVTMTSPPALPSPLPPFEFKAICPMGDKLVPLILQTGTTTFTAEQEPYRRFTRLAAIPVWPAAQNRAYTPARVLRIVLNEGFVMLGEQYRGLGGGGAAMRPPGFYSWQELAVPPPRRDLASLPLRLFALKNGDQDDRRAFEEIQRMFEALAPGRAMEIRFAATAPQPETTVPVVQSALSPLAEAFEGTSGLGSSGESTPGAAVTVLVLDDRGRELPVVQVGAGTWEALALAEALTVSEHRTVILDEPALNLHPTWQHILRTSFRQFPGQLILVTHSAELVPMGDEKEISRVIRLDSAGGATRAHRLPSDIDAQTAAKIVRVFTLSADARALLFASGAVLVEGETELGALPEWFAAAASDAELEGPEELDLGFYCVGGDQHFFPVLTLLQSLGIPWVAICDGAAFDAVKAHRWHVFRQVFEAGAGNDRLVKFLEAHIGQQGTSMTDALFQEQKEIARENGVFTLALGWTTRDKQAGTQGDESFEAFLEAINPGKLSEAKGAVGLSKVRQGRWLAENLDCPANVAALYAALVRRLRRAS